MAEEVAIVANFMINKGPVEAGAGDRRETALDPKMRRRQFVRERNVQSNGDLTEPLLCFPMPLDSLSPAPLFAEALTQDGLSDLSVVAPGIHRPKPLSNSPGLFVLHALRVKLQCSP